MDLRRIFQKKPKALDAGSDEDASPLGDAIAELTGVFVHDESSIDLDGVRHAINDAREEALIRQQGREAAAEMD